jgi:long-chain acyl-CoA synthetase
MLEKPMYPGEQARMRPDRPAIIMAGSGESISYRELDARSNRLAHLLRAAGLGRGDHYAVFMENHPRYVEFNAAGERSGLYYTNVNPYLTAGELAYIIDNSLSKVLIASEAKRETALAALAERPGVELCLIVDGPGRGPRVRNLDEATASFPASPIPDESLGTAMLYSSGTTGILRGRPAGRRACCGPCPTSRLPRRCRPSALSRSSGASAKDRSPFRRRRSITPRPGSALPERSASAARWS